MKKNLTIEKLDKGYVIRSFELDPGELYAGKNIEASVASSDEVVGLVSRWLDSDHGEFKVDVDS